MITIKVTAFYRELIFMLYWSPKIIQVNISEESIWRRGGGGLNQRVTIKFFRRVTGFKITQNQNQDTMVEFKKIQSITLS